MTATEKKIERVVDPKIRNAIETETAIEIEVETETGESHPNTNIEIKIEIVVEVESGHEEIRNDYCQ